MHGYVINIHTLARTQKNDLLNGVFIFYKHTYDGKQTKCKLDNIVSSIWIFVVVRRPFSYTLMKSKLYRVFIYVHEK